MKIEGKVIVITGAARGIGQEYARYFGSLGARVVIADINDCAQTLELVRAEKGAAVGAKLDVASAASAMEMARTALDAFGRIDALINNAGFGFYGSVENTPPDVVREIFALNFEAALLACQLVIPIMKASGSGHIINISSVAGRRGLPLNGIYSATKFALNGMSEALRIELQGSGILVSIINPAATETEFGDSVRYGDVKEKFKAMGHVQSSEEVAAAIVRCIKDPRIEVYPYGLSKVLAWGNAIAPSLVDKIIMRAYRDRMRARASAST